MNYIYYFSRATVLTLNFLLNSHSFAFHPQFCWTKSACQQTISTSTFHLSPLSTLTLSFLIRNALSREEKRFSDLLLSLLLIMISLLLCLAELTNNHQPINNTFKRFNLTEYQCRLFLYFQDGNLNSSSSDPNLLVISFFYNLKVTILW